MKVFNDKLMRVNTKPNIQVSMTSRNLKLNIFACGGPFNEEQQ